MYHQTSHLLLVILTNSLQNAFIKSRQRYPNVIDGFGCEKVTDKVYVGVDRSGFPVILFEIDQIPPNFIPIHTRALTVNLFINCAINFHENTTFKGDFLCLSCTSQDEDLYGTFFKLIESIFLLQNHSSSVSELIESLNNLVILFQKLFDPPKKNIVGLFGELLVINEATNINLAIKSWHSQISDLMDFSWAGGRLEVKTTTSQNRTHDFSLEQLRPIPDLFKCVASVNLQEVHDGVSTIDLIDSILAKVKSPELVCKLWEIVFDTLGQNYAISHSRKFDYLTAKKSLKFFNAERVPSPDFRLPIGVSSVRFTANLDETVSLNNSDSKSLIIAGLL